MLGYNYIHFIFSFAFATYTFVKRAEAFITYLPHVRWMSIIAHIDLSRPALLIYKPRDVNSLPINNVPSIQS